MEFLQKNSKYIGYGGCILMLLGNFLPFVTVTVSIFGISKSESIKFIDGDGMFVIIAAIVTAVLLYLKKEKFSLISTGIALAVTLYDISNAESMVGNALGLGDISYGIGFWVILIGVVLAAGSVVINYLKDKNQTTKVEENPISDEKSKFCSECGSKVKSTSKFCNHCGKEMKN